jgi:5-(carboxyamino)imidazole ribonucleotide synthase
MFDNLKVGILGGGQLGAMLLRYAIDFGLDVSVLDKDPKAPCSRYSSSFTVGDPMKYEDVISFGRQLDIITIEKEAVNVEALRTLGKMGVKIYPSPDTLEIIQDKFLQKQFLIEHKIPVVKGWLVQDKSELENHTEKLPACLKKCTDGYDGKGVLMLQTVEDLSKAFDSPCVLEEIVDIKKEVSVIVSRNEAGIIECYDPVMMIFDKERMLLDFQICPADIDESVATYVCTIATKVAEAIKLTGIMAVEMFIASNGKIYVNELAPRPHNSGHHTIEASQTSQFEQQLRVILGLPMGKAKMTQPSVMVNILEPAVHRRQVIMEALKTILCTDDVHLHWYGKTPGSMGRKMGHVTITDKKIEDAISKSIMIRHLLKENHDTESSNNNG